MEKLCIFLGDWHHLDRGEIQWRNVFGNIAAQFSDVLSQFTTHEDPIIMVDAGELLLIW
jgi:hypothetical protein